MPFLDDYMGDVFEWICRDYTRLYAQEVPGVPASQVEQIWAVDFDLAVAGLEARAAREPNVHLVGLGQLLGR